MKNWQPSKPIKIQSKKATVASARGGGGEIVLSAKREKNQPSKPIKIQCKQATAPSARERKTERTT